MICLINHAVFTQVDPLIEKPFEQLVQYFESSMQVVHGALHLATAPELNLSALSTM